MAPPMPPETPVQSGPVLRPKETPKTAVFPARAYRAQNTQNRLRFGAVWDPFPPRSYQRASVLYSCLPPCGDARGDACMSICMHMCICMSVDMPAGVYACMHVCVWLNVYMHKYTSIYIYACRCARGDMYVSPVCIYTWMHVCLHACVYACIRVYMHVYMLVWFYACM